MPVAPRRAPQMAGRAKSGPWMRATQIAFLCVILGWLGFLILVAYPARSMPRCDLALSLVFDVSTSMNREEYERMRDGVAASLLDDEIWQDAGGVMIQVVAFADKPVVMIPWTPASERGDVATRVSRMARPNIGSNTAIGTTMAFVASQMLPCDRQVIDLASDGENTSGPHPSVVRPTLDQAIMINGLATTEAAARSMQAFVIQGIGAFVQPAMGYEDFARALKEKLTRELYLG